MSKVTSIQLDGSREKTQTQMTGTRKERGDITTDPTENERLVREYREHSLGAGLLVTARLVVLSLSELLRPMRGV